MRVIEVLFWLGVFIIFYTYLGYGILLYVLVRIKRLGKPGSNASIGNFEPAISFIVPSYNEADCIAEKVRNSLALDYPAAKLKIIVITDGSDDGTPDIVRDFEGVILLHQTRREGKAAAENRAMKYVDTPIVVFSDANTYLPPDTLRNLVKHYADPAVGGVAGEKRIAQKNRDAIAAAGEGLYWKYESFLKRLDSELFTVVGAAGELFSFRRELFTDFEPDIILDDFILSLRIAGRGYKVVYEPSAYAVEKASASITEELKRKIRNSAGAWQALIRLGTLLNPFPRFVLTFQYVSHKVLRWSVAPVFLFLLIPLNLLLYGESILYRATLVSQLLLYAAGALGWFLESREREIKLKFLAVPFYFLFANYAAILGFFRYFGGRQSSVWERARRA